MILTSCIVVFSANNIYRLVYKKSNFLCLCRQQHAAEEEKKKAIELVDAAEKKAKALEDAAAAEALLDESIQKKLDEEDEQEVIPSRDPSLSSLPWLWLQKVLNNGLEPLDIKITQLSSGSKTSKSGKVSKRSNPRDKDDPLAFLQIQSSDNSDTGKGTKSSNITVKADVNFESETNSPSTSTGVESKQVNATTRVQL